MILLCNIVSEAHSILICGSLTYRNLHFCFEAFRLFEVNIVFCRVTPNHNFFMPHHQGPDFDDMSSFFPCEVDDAIQYINFGYGAQAPKMVIL